MNKYILHFDGSCWPNPDGKAKYGLVLQRNGETIISQSGIIGQGEGMTNNLAEHVGLYRGLQHYEIQAIYPSELNIYSDSQLVVKQMNEEWKASLTKPYYEYYALNLHKIKELKKDGHNITIQWIPREQNQKADELSKA